MYFLLFLLFTTKAIATFIGVRAWEKLPYVYRILTIQIALVFIVEASGWFINAVLKAPNLWLFNTYNLVELCLTLFIAQQLLARHTTNNKWPYILVAPVILFWIYRGFVTSWWTQLLNWSYLSGYILLLLTYIILLFHLSNTGKKLVSEPAFWLSLGVILFCGATIPLYGLFTYLADNDIDLMYKLYYINQIAGIIKYSLFGISFYIIAKATNTQPDVQPK